ncbi:CBS domain-containing protein [Lewinella cohaerens]|jgi:predicted transcriptional regulator|uniref:CBS domain-containing protein n=1 Tax=Lewinella cohaerens TaxID=70995 RepID=UPI00037FF203|nr:CBS domain-containing protein [Lewinella cohaerens]
MKKRTPVSKIMTTNLISVNASNDVADVVQIFKENNIHHIPVVSGDELIGMISKTDIDRISYVNSYATEAANAVVYEMLKLEQVMTSELETIQAEDQIKEAAELLAQGKYHALPVMEGKKITGIVTSTDVIKYLLEQF